ncbi:MAG: TolC family protein [Clostridia bacterium]|nr:TolC family protein [Clostridia bacterium]
MKRIISALIMISMMFSVFPSFAQDDTDVYMQNAVNIEQGREIYTLSLEEAIAMSTRDNSELAVCDINKQNLEKQLKDARLTQRDAKNIPIYMNQNFELVYVKNGYYINMYKKYIELSAYERKKIEATIAYDTTHKYYTYKNALSLLETAKNGLERAKSNLDIISQKFNLGMCTQLEVTNAQISVSECEANIIKCQQNAELCKESLKIRLNIDGDCEFNLTDDVMVNEFSGDAVTDIPKALEQRYDVKALTIAAQLSQEYFEATKSLDTDSTIYFSAYTEYIESTHNYNNGIKNISLAIKSAYYDVINAQNASKIAKSKLEFTQNQYEVSKLQFEMGMITNFILSAKSDELTAAEIAYTNALLTEKLAVENYNYQIMIGI